MESMSAKDKKMLMCVGLVGLVVVLYMYVVTPIMDEKEANVITIAQKESELEVLNMENMEIDILSAQLMQKKEIVELHSTYFYGDMYTWEAERVLKRFTDAVDITIDGLEIKSKTQLILPAVETNDADGNVTRGETSPSNASYITLTINTSLNYENFVLFIDSIEADTQKISIDKWSYAGVDLTYDADGNVVGNYDADVETEGAYHDYSIDAQVTIYMFNGDVDVEHGGLGPQEPLVHNVDEDEENEENTNDEIEEDTDDSDDDTDDEE